MALTAPWKAAVPVPAFTVSWLVPPAMVLLNTMFELVDCTARSAASVTGLLNVIAPAAVPVMPAVSVMPVPLTVLAV